MNSEPTVVTTSDSRTVDKGISLQFSWGTRLGFYFAALGSAFGLGNLWRFPYVVADNGGGAFVIIYIGLAFVLGLPMMVGELILGKATRKSTYGAMVGHKQWVLVAAFAMLVTMFVLSYYAVITGWVLHHVIQTVGGLFSQNMYDTRDGMTYLRTHGWMQMGLATFHLCIITIVAIKGVEHGLERWVGLIMPFFGALMVVLIVQTLSLPAAGNALKFLFYPDFTKVTWSALLQAVGHVMFTLSIGFGTMVTFGSYFRDSERVPSAAYRVTLLDTIMSLLAGMLIFPVLLTSEQNVHGPEVLFQALNALFMELEQGWLLALAFFIFLYLGALTSSLGLLESVVTSVMDWLKVTRTVAAIGVAVVIWILSLVPTVGSAMVDPRWLGGITVLEVLDRVVINLLLPLSALGMSVFIVWVIKDTIKLEQFEVSHAISRLYQIWRFMVKWVAPIIIIAAILLEFFGILVDLQARVGR